MGFALGVVVTGLRWETPPSAPPPERQLCRPCAGVGFRSVGELLSSDLTVLDTEGRTVRLRDLSAGRALVIVFLRHFG